MCVCKLMPCKLGQMCMCASGFISKGYFSIKIIFIIEILFPFLVPFWVEFAASAKFRTLNWPAATSILCGLFGLKHDDDDDDDDTVTWRFPTGQLLPN